MARVNPAVAERAAGCRVNEAYVCGSCSFRGDMGDFTEHVMCVDAQSVSRAAPAPRGRLATQIFQANLVTPACSNCGSQVCAGGGG